MRPRCAARALALESVYEICVPRDQFAPAQPALARQRVTVRPRLALDTCLSPCFGCYKLWAWLASVSHAASHYLAPPTKKRWRRASVRSRHVKELTTPRSHKCRPIGLAAKQLSGRAGEHPAEYKITASHRTNKKIGVASESRRQVTERIQKQKCRSSRTTTRRVP